MNIITLLKLLITLSLVHPTSAFSTSRIKVNIASIPSDLPSIQACRRTAYENQTNLFDSAKSFCNADQIQREGYICAIAKTSDGTVVGTADLNQRSGVVNNVYVVKEARQQGIAQLLMKTVEDAMIMDNNNK